MQTVAYLDIKQLEINTIIHLGHVFGYMTNLYPLAFFTVLVSLRREIYSISLCQKCSSMLFSWNANFLLLDAGQVTHSALLKICPLHLKKMMIKVLLNQNIKIVSCKTKTMYWKMLKCTEELGGIALLADIYVWVSHHKQHFARSHKNCNSLT